MKHGNEHRPFIVATGIAVFATAVLAAWIGFSIGGEKVAAYVDDLATVLAALAATLLSLRAGLRHRDRMRLFWLLLAAACGAWTLAELVWATYDLVLSGPVPIPSFADAGYLAAIPLAVAALLFHPAMYRVGARKTRAVLDGLVIATALLFLSWTLVLGSLWRSTDVTTLGGVVTIAYPFSDVLIVFFIVLVIRGMMGSRLALWCLLGGLLFTALSDSTYLYLAETENYATGNLVDVGWIAGYLGIALGAFCSHPRAIVARRAGPSLPSLSQLVVPFVPVLVALSVAAIEIQFGNRLDAIAWLAAFFLVTLVLVRQGLLVVDLFTPTGRDVLR